jgi:SAM-dependent methyltransferase
MTRSIDLYTSGDYALKHQNWHLEDAPNKASDIMPALLAVVESRRSQTLRIADIGAGTGAVIVEVVKRLSQTEKNLRVDAVGFEISPFAVQTGGKLFPDLDLREKFFESSDGLFDLVLFIDVLEHLENPWEILRTAHDASQYMIVRQPLLDNFSTFRHDNYCNQRDHWGHIAYFNYRSFMDMTKATGWKPLKVDLLASWELSENRGKRFSPIHYLFNKVNRLMASYFFSGFYLNAAFERF